MMIFFSSAEEQHRIQTKISYTKIIIFFVKSISRIFFCEKWNAWTPTRRQKKLSFRSLITVNVEDRSQLKKLYYSATKPKSRTKKIYYSKKNTWNSNEFLKLCDLFRLGYFLKPECILYSIIFKSCTFTPLTDSQGR